jgi:hypothetical protein
MVLPVASIISIAKDFFKLIINVIYWPHILYCRHHIIASIIRLQKVNRKGVMHAIFFWKFYSINQTMRFNDFNNRQKTYVLVCKIFAKSSLINMLYRNQYLLFDLKVSANSLFIILMLIFLICFVQKLHEFLMELLNVFCFGFPLNGPFQRIAIK